MKENDQLPKPENNVFDICSGAPVEGGLDDEFFAYEKKRTLETLQELKEMVERDEAVGIAIVLGRRNGHNRELTTVDTVFSSAAAEYSATFMGGLEVLKQRIYEDIA